MMSVCHWISFTDSALIASASAEQSPRSAATAKSSKVTRFASRSRTSGQGLPQALIPVGLGNILQTSSPEIVAELCSEMRFLDRELLRVVLLNAKQHLIKVVTVSHVRFRIKCD